MKGALSGFRDLFGEYFDSYDSIYRELLKFRHIESTCREVAESFGYTEIMQNTVEREEVFVRSVGTDSDIISKVRSSSSSLRQEVYKLTTPSAELSPTQRPHLVLRPEATAPTMRFLLEHEQLLAGVSRPVKPVGSNQTAAHLLSGGNVPPRPAAEGSLSAVLPVWYIHEANIELGIEHVGTESVAADCENIVIAHKVLSALRIPAWELRINSIGDLAARGRYNEVLRTHYLRSDVLRLLSKESKDKVVRNLPLLRIMDSKDPGDIEASANAPKISEYLSPASRSNFTRLLESLKDLGIPYTPDPKMVRGLDYYNDACFEFVMSHPALGPSQNTILAGGRYDSLAETLGSRQHVPAAGWAAGIDRLMCVLPAVEEKKQAKISVVTALVRREEMTGVGKEGGQNGGESLRDEGCGGGTSQDWVACCGPLRLHSAQEPTSSLGHGGKLAGLRGL